MYPPREPVRIKQIKINAVPVRRNNFKNLFLYSKVSIEVIGRNKSKYPASKFGFPRVE